MLNWLKRFWKRLFGNTLGETNDSSGASQKEASGESKFRVLECEIIDIEDEDDEQISEGNSEMTDSEDEEIEDFTV